MRTQRSQPSQKDAKDWGSLGGSGHPTNGEDVVPEFLESAAEAEDRISMRIARGACIGADCADVAAVFAVFD